jgi:hypothetical protein
MKNYLVKVYTVVLAVCGLAACADLDLPSDGRLTLNEMFNEYYRTKNYYKYCYTYIPLTGFTYGNTPLASFCDEAHDASDGVSGAVNDWYNNRTSAFNNPLEFYWSSLFIGILKCNTFLQCIDDPEIATATIDTDEKNGWIGEVHVLRAFYYLQLIKRYGGVPLLDTPYEVTHDFSQDRRASFEECVDFIIADCDYALAIPESGKASTGFRWNIGDEEKGIFTRAVAYAVKSQAALYAASPLWYAAGSKYTWEKAAEITKEALDQCLAHGFELFNTKPAEDIAQNAYAYYFINPSDASRSVDKETIYESEGRLSVWSLAGTPVTEGAVKAGAGPSQELVDAYEMRATGKIPVTGYRDANHTDPVIDYSSGYDANNPYAGRDPRFEASIYYNGSARSLFTGGEIEKQIFPLTYREDEFPGQHNNVEITPVDDNTFTLKVTGGDPFFYTTNVGELVAEGADSILPSTGERYLAFEYKAEEATDKVQFFFCMFYPDGATATDMNIVDRASEWDSFEYNLFPAIEQWGFGSDWAHYIRFDLPEVNGYTLTIRNLRIECMVPPPPAMPVETFVDGNCGISNDITETRYTRTGYYMRKFNNYKSNAQLDGDGFMKIFRLGELYLNYAEAAAEAGGRDAEARAAVNKVRARAGMPDLPATLTGSDLISRIRNERRVELAFEEHRFFDVRRWKILNQTDGFVTGMRIIKKDDDTYTYNRIKLQDRGTNSDKYLMFPIIQSEVAKMENYTPDVNWQNPGW